MAVEHRACVDLSGLEFRTFDAASHWKNELDDAGVAAERASQDRAWQRGRVVRWVAAPIVWIKRWRTARQVERAHASHVEDGGRLAELLASRAAFEVVDGELVSERHGCRLKLPEGATVRQADRVAWRDSTVFTLWIGAFRVHATAHTPDEVRALAEKGIAGERARIVEDVMVDAQGWPGRVLRVQVAAVDDLGRTTGIHRRWVGFVAGPTSVIRLEASDRDPTDQSFNAVFAAIVGSIRFR